MYTWLLLGSLGATNDIDFDALPRRLHGIPTPDRRRLLPKLVSKPRAEHVVALVGS